MGVWLPKQLEQTNSSPLLRRCTHAPLLPLVVLVMALMDYTTTWAALELSGNIHIDEGGLLAGWALRVGGLGWLFLIDMGAVAGMTIAALCARLLFFRLGFYGFGRAAFVAVLLPYAVVALAASMNNLIVSFT